MFVLIKIGDYFSLLFCMLISFIGDYCLGQRLEFTKANQVGIDENRTVLA